MEERPRVLQASTCGRQFCFVCFALAFLRLLNERRDQQEDWKRVRGGACWADRAGSRGPAPSLRVQFVLPLLLSHSLRNGPVPWASALGALYLGWEDGRGMNKV